jgi:hypothetical protein
MVTVTTRAESLLLGHFRLAIASVALPLVPGSLRSPMEREPFPHVVFAELQFPSGVSFRAIITALLSRWTRFRMAGQFTVIGTSKLVDSPPFQMIRPPKVSCAEQTAPSSGPASASLVPELRGGPVQHSWLDAVRV